MAEGRRVTGWRMSWQVLASFEGPSLLVVLKVLPQIKDSFACIDHSNYKAYHGKESLWSIQEAMLKCPETGEA